MNHKPPEKRKVMVRVRLKPEDVAYVDALGDKNRTDGLELCIDTTRTLEQGLRRNGNP